MCVLFFWVCVSVPLFSQSFSVQQHGVRHQGFHLTSPLILRPVLMGCDCICFYLAPKRLYKRDVALGAVNSRTGKSLTLKDIEFLESRESQKTAEVVAVRLENIKLKNRWAPLSRR